MDEGTSTRRRGPKRVLPLVCTVDGCENKCVARGWCQTHWLRWRTHGDVQAHVPVKVWRASRSACLVPWCAKVVVGGHLCVAHESSMSRAYPGEGEDWGAWALAVLPTDQCWLWPFGKNQDGYGAGPGGERAHRYMLRLVGRPVPDGLESLHQCDVRACVNPSHIEHGTHLENMREMWDRNDRPRKEPRVVQAGRRRGSRSDGVHARSKLTVEQVHTIRQRFADGHSTQAVAEELGVSYGAVFGIRRGVSWRNVT